MEVEERTERLLILACSRRKRGDHRLLPAIERYDGPTFRIFRRFARERPSEAPDVLILSAEHGLISQDTPVALYDRSMTPARARELRPQVLVELDRLTGDRRMAEVLVCAGRRYLTALGADGARLPDDAKVKVCGGALGSKIAQLHDWLHGHPPPLRYNAHVIPEGTAARIQGVEVTMTPDQVLAAAADALAEGWGDPERYESWCVPVDGSCVAPKWLVSRISGLSVGSFTTDDARRLLARLGVEVRRA